MKKTNPNYITNKFNIGDRVTCSKCIGVFTVAKTFFNKRFGTFEYVLEDDDGGWGEVSYFEHDLDLAIIK